MFEVGLVRSVKRKQNCRPPSSSIWLTAAVQAAVEDPSHRIEGVLECAGSRVSDFRSKPLCQLRLRFTLTALCSPPH